MVMKMLSRLFTIMLVFFFMGLISCSEPTMEEDARKAAELAMMSNQYSRDNDLANASRAYGEVQEIMTKYKKKNKFDEFYQLYIGFMHESSYRIEGGASE